jgi:CTD kinase subunit gamma
MTLNHSYGVHEWMIVSQTLENWRTKRVIDPQKIDDVLSALNSRTTDVDPSQAAPQPAHQDHLSRNDVFKRIEEDRERHKRLRERRWVQPITHNTTDYRSLPLACFVPLTGPTGEECEQPFDIEFENEWETTSDWNEDDDEAAAEESELCFGAEGEAPMDLAWS